MPKTKPVYQCSACGARFPKWSGQCPECEAWNSLSESALTLHGIKGTRVATYAGEDDQDRLLPLAAIVADPEVRHGTGIQELDRVLGGGMVRGSVVLIGGDPGIGKSTLLIQAAAALGQRFDTLYVNGEESLQQVSLRAQRLGIGRDGITLLAETQVERILDAALQRRPRVLVIDSIQTIYTDTLQSPPGAVAQLRDGTAQLVRFAKQTGTTVFLIGHVTKEGTLAGPRILEHMVDTVLYFEGDGNSRYRVIRTVKNRFGAVNELGVFAMTDKGLREVSNPSAIFLSHHDTPIPGSLVMVTKEGSRPLLVEVQTLVAESHLGNPRRLCVGLDQNRLVMLLAVLQRHAGIPMYDQDVFVNIVGGVRVAETAADLAVLLAAVSSLRGRPLPPGTAAFGEVGLAGEIRPVQNGLDRIREAAKHGFKRVLVPKANAPKPKQMVEQIQVVGISRLSEAMDVTRESD
jgi:DNA repair protein RadA/Sms